MTLSERLQLRNATPDDAAALAGLTWPTFHPLLSVDDDRRTALRPLCHAVWLGEVPVGLTVSMRSERDADEQTLLSLMVKPVWRRQGIGRALLRNLYGALAAQEIRALEVRYSDRLPGAGMFAALLQSEGWSEPLATRRRICGAVRDTVSIFRDRGKVLERLLREGFRVLTWREAGERALALAAALEENGEAPAWADPTPWRHRLHPEASLVLVDARDQVRGWVICEYQEALARWYFPIGWVRAPQAGRGWLLGAYAEGARRLAEAHGDGAMVVVETGRAQAGMWRLLDRHFQPHVHWADHLMESQRGTP